MGLGLGWAINMVRSKKLALVWVKLACGVPSGDRLGRTKGETVADYGSGVDSWSLVAWQQDHRISSLGEIGFWGTGSYGRNWLPRIDGLDGPGGTRAGRRD